MSVKKLQSFDEELYNPIKNILNSKFVYIPNPGNYGDSLIREGTLTFFEKNKFDFVCLDANKLFNGAIKEIDINNIKMCVFGGGGAWCKFYFNRTKKIIEKLFEYFDHVVVLPSTYEDFDGIKVFLKEIENKNITFFRRDDFISKNSIPESILAPDMALFLDFINISNDNIYREGFFFRIDGESGLKHKYTNNYDLSSHGDEKSDIINFFNYINQYQIIHTDRLHVAIAGYLLGKEVFLYNNSYNKIKSFYDTYFKDKTNIKYLG